MRNVYNIPIRDVWALRKIMPIKWSLSAWLRALWIEFSGAPKQSERSLNPMSSVAVPNGPPRTDSGAIIGAPIYGNGDHLVTAATKGCAGVEGWGD